MPNPNPEPHPENLRPFPPGVSGNPGGRPKSKPITDRLRDRLERPAREALRLDDGATLADVIALRMAKAAAEGDFKYVRELLDRVEGKPVPQPPEQDHGADAPSLDEWLNADG